MPDLSQMAKPVRGRPSQLQLNPSKTGATAFGPLITLEGALHRSTLDTDDIREQAISSPRRPMLKPDTPLKSPCFVHSQLEKGASLVDWLRNTHIKGNVSVNVAKSLGTPTRAVTATPPNGILTPTRDDDDDDANSMSLTRQLAETAVGVREMSKALGEWPLIVT